MVSAALLLAGIVLSLVFLFQPVLLIRNGVTETIRTSGLTPQEILQQAGLRVTSADRMSPDPSSLYLGGAPIRFNQIAAYLIYIGGDLSSLYAADPIPANVLLQAGIRLFPQDRVQMDGVEIDAQSAQPWRGQHTIQLARSRLIQILLPDGSAQTVSVLSADPQAIRWELGLPALAAEIEPQQGAAGAETYRVVLPTEYAAPASPVVTISQSSLGKLLAGVGEAPQGLDFFTDQTLPGNGSVDQAPVQRVEEQLVTSPKSLPYQSRAEMDDTLELDQQKVTQSGQYGVAMQLTRSRLRDGEVIATNVEQETIIQPPVDEVTGYGTKINIHTLDVGGTSIEYYRAISMYATSYSPCRSGTTGCSYGTASGEKVRKGIVAVIPRWFAYMSGAQVYIPGYGFAIIGDTGGGISGTDWIDLAYTDDEFIAWHSYVTVYFLTPVPDNILYDLN